jgi:hypothetical protein
MDPTTDSDARRADTENLEAAQHILPTVECYVPPDGLIIIIIINSSSSLISSSAQSENKYLDRRLTGRTPPEISNLLQGTCSLHLQSSASSLSSRAPSLVEDVRNLLVWPSRSRGAARMDNHNHHHPLTSSSESRLTELVGPVLKPCEQVRKPVGSQPIRIQNLN